MVSAEIIRRFVRPAHIQVYCLYEYARSFPLDVDEYVQICAVAILFFFLIEEYSQSGIPGGGVPFGVVSPIGAYLHLHHVLYDVELDVIP